MANPTQAIQPVNSNFNTGIDGASVTLNDSAGNVYPLGKIIDFHATPEHNTIEVKSINLQGRILRKKNLNGWKGTITVARENGTLDALQAAEETRQLTGQPQMYYNIYHFVSNQDGSVDEFQYVKCVVTLVDPGQWELGKEVPMKLDFESEQRVKLT